MKRFLKVRLVGGEAQLFREAAEKEGVTPDELANRIAKDLTKKAKPR